MVADLLIWICSIIASSCFFIWLAYVSERVRKVKRLIPLSLLFGLLCGCLYPQEERLQLNQLPVHVERVQSAVDLYFKEKNVLPYRYKEDEIKFTSKAVVDFQALKGYIDQIPPSAYENGGFFIYVLTNVEEKPLVRLFDLRVNDQVEKVQIMVNDYKQEHNKLPIQEKIDQRHATIDFQKLRMDEIQIPSPYDSTATLPFIMDQQGKVMIDYRAEAMKMIQKAKVKPSEEEDLRFWMAKQSLYVPAFSLPMKYMTGEPVFLSNQE